MSVTTIEWAEYIWNPITEATLRSEKMKEPVLLRDPRRILVCSVLDLFHKSVPTDFITETFMAMNSAPQHTYLILTKRPRRMASFIEAWGNLGEHIWPGISCENQATANERIPVLVEIPAAVRWICYKPPIGPLDLGRWLVCEDCARWGVEPAADGWRYQRELACGIPRVNWVVCGGEIGPGARPMYPDWVRDLRDQCQAAGVPFFFEGWGEWVSPYARHGSYEDLEGERRYLTYKGLGTDVVRVGCKTAGRLLDGREWNELPKRDEGRA